MEESPLRYKASQSAYSQFVLQTKVVQDLPSATFRICIFLRPADILLPLGHSVHRPVLPAAAAVAALAFRHVAVLAPLPMHAEFAVRTRSRGWRQLGPTAMRETQRDMPPCPFRTSRVVAF